MSRTRYHLKNNNKRINFIFVVFLCVQLVFLFRLFQIQILHHDRYKAMADNQHWDLQELEAKRGRILSSEGFPLATNRASYLMYFNPSYIDDPHLFAKEISNKVYEIKKQKSPDVELSEQDLYSKYYSLAELDLLWVSAEKSLTEEEKQQIEELGIKGIGFEEGFERHYPENQLASHVLGFVASDTDGEHTGYYGVEGSLDGELKGKKGRIVEERDVQGTPILLGGSTRVDPVDGRDVVLTINRALQYIVEEKLREGVEKYEAETGTVIVMDPFTGDIISMANFPTYDPTKYSEIADEENTIIKKNLGISETYEPGSVLKPITVAAALDLGVITPYSTFVDDGPVEYSGYTIDNWDEKHHGVQDISQLLEKSNNIGAAWVGHLTGAQNIYDYFTKFGYGSLSGVELEGEDTGIIRDYNEWSDIDLAAISFGQGISATPLQVLNSFNVIVNGGDLIQPRIVARTYEGDTTIENPTKVIRRVISKGTSETMVGLLENAVAQGESKYFNIKSHRLAGKTGTAQIPVDGEYDPTQTNTTFVGFLPGSRNFTMLVRLDRPSASTYAAETAVPLWMDIASELIKYYSIPPDAKQPVESTIHPGS